MSVSQVEDLYVTSFTADQIYSPLGGKRAALVPKVTPATPLAPLERAVVAAFHWDLITFPHWTCQLSFVNLIVFDDMSVHFESNFYGKRGDVWIIRPGITFFQNFGTGMAQIGRPLGQHDSPSSNPPPGFDAGDNYFQWDDTIDGVTRDTVKLINAVSGWANHC
jgi:hypothetical protein